MKELHTPTLDRIGETSDISQQIGNFLDWLINECGLSICDEFTVDIEVGGDNTFCPVCDSEITDEWRGDPPRYYWPVVSGGMGIRRLLYGYFKIDQGEAEAERRLLRAILFVEAQA